MFKWIRKYRKRILLFSFLVIMLIISGGYLYLKNATYEAMPQATSLLENEAVKVENNMIIVEPDKAAGNIVFYQGGLVETEAYLPLAIDLSEEGYRIFLPYMPLNLAILNTSAFEDIYESYPSDLPWWIGGHSLGGTSALISAEENQNVIRGALLLGAYPSEDTDISESELEVLSIVASNDHILNQKNYEESKILLPKDTTYLQIMGGNHSNFGYYGSQKGDGESDVSREEQKQEIIESFLEKAKK